MKETICYTFTTWLILIANFCYFEKNVLLFKYFTPYMYKIALIFELRLIKLHYMLLIIAKFLKIEYLIMKFFIQTIGLFLKKTEKRKMFQILAKIFLEYEA